MIHPLTLALGVRHERPTDHTFDLPPIQKEAVLPGTASSEENAAGSESLPLGPAVASGAVDQTLRGQASGGQEGDGVAGNEDGSIELGRQFPDSGAGEVERLGRKGGGGGGGGGKRAMMVAHACASWYVVGLGAPSTSSMLGRSDGLRCRYTRSVMALDEWPSIIDTILRWPQPRDLILKFLCETVHPTVRHDIDQTEQLVRYYNESLAPYGIEVAPSGVTKQADSNTISTMPTATTPNGIGSWTT
jgi:hypothetical protein